MIHAEGFAWEIELGLNGTPCCKVAKLKHLAVKSRRAAASSAGMAKPAMARNPVARLFWL
jgi:hypothetical protein